MGNSNLLSNTCMSSTDLCNTANNNQSKYEENIILKRNKVRSTQQIKQSILKYIENNRLQLYSVRERKVLETLVSVEQEHIGDKIIELYKRLKLLQNEKKQLQRLKNKETTKPTANEKEAKEKTQINDRHQQKQKDITSKITLIKDKRKKLFQQSQCLLLEDLDMIFEQIPKFDQNYDYLNSILTLSGTLMEKAKQDSNNLKNQSQLNFINQLTKTGRSAPNKSLNSLKNQIHHTNLGENIYNHRNTKKDKKIQQKIKELLKIEDKKTLKKNPTINSLGSEILQTNGLLMIVPIECFSGIGALRDNNKTGLPSGASLLQILMNKIKAVNLRRGCNLGVVFMVNDKYASKFNEQIHKVQGFQQFIAYQKMQINSSLSNHGSDENYKAPIPYHVVQFKNIWPSFDSEQKILIDSVDDQIVFSTHDGDLFAFVENSIELKMLIEKYRYVNITNINNLLSQIGDAHVLGFMEDRQEIDIAAKVLKPKTQQITFSDYFTLDDQQFFTLKQVLDKSEDQSSIDINQKYISYIANQNFLDTEEYYVKSRIFTAQSGPLKRLLMSRISRKLNPECENYPIQFYLNRSISSVLYSKFTAFITVDEDHEFSHVKSSVPHFKPHVKKNGQLGYSRYCKKLLGINESSEGRDQEELVQIDAGILHKGSDEIMRLISSLKKVKQVGFPIILYSDLFNNSKNES